MGANGFGHVEVEDNLLVSYTDDQKKPTVHKFESVEIVNAFKVIEELSKRIEDYKKKKDVHLKRMLEWSEEEEKKPEKERAKTVPSWSFTTVPKSSIYYEDIEALIKETKQKLLDVYNQ